MAYIIDNEVIVREKQSFSKWSLNSISLQSTGQELGENEIKCLSFEVTEDIKNLLNEAGKYSRRTRLFLEGILDWNVLEELEEPRTESPVSIPEVGPMDVEVTSPYEPDNPGAIEIPLNSSIDSAGLSETNNPGAFEIAFNSSLDSAYLSEPDNPGAIEVPLNLSIDSACLSEPNNTGAIEIPLNSSLDSACLSEPNNSGAIEVPLNTSLDSTCPNKPDNPDGIDIPLKSSLDSAYLRKKRSGWTSQELALLMPCKNLPVTKEQVYLYHKVTESMVLGSVATRELGLEALSTDPTFIVLLPNLSLFIADVVLINVAEENTVSLFFLMRMVNALLSNENLNLDNYLHLILPAVLSCLLTKQMIPSIGMADHWSLREFCGSIAADIVRSYDGSDNRLLLRVIDIYEQALLKQSLTTMYGAVIGLGKIGDEAVRTCILPKLKYISERIEPHLKESMAYSSASLHTLAAKFISHRLMKMCSPLLNYSPQDPPEAFAATYGFLGPMLRAAVFVSHVKVDVEISENWRKLEEAAKSAQQDSDLDDLCL
ncbi:transcription initiation factor TFIID subunit 6-like isoform X2 [Drosophila serrata]|uniref:transcription initiation factor TFIID subunit 6-like isoform X2 n=1 Tax=Drosophila serrata TaxID=7274 RepID=UPI000A1D02E6|nr:transcription initiation factor TFIID subunit 6-like isoform X2 [Drosophila serrata]